MRRFLTLALTATVVCATGLVATPADAAALPDWVRPAPASKALEVAPAFAGKLAPMVANRPAMLLATDYYFYPYSGGDRPTVYLTVDGNGYSEPVSMWLYWENRKTGERRFLSQSGGLLPRGTVRDLFGAAGSPLAIFAPSVTKLKLLGDGGALGQAPLLPTGMYQFVVELRDASGATVISRDNAMYSHVDGVVSVSGTIIEDTVWTNNNAYLLDSAPVYIGGNPITDNPPLTPTNLFIEPGTVVLGSTANQGTLVVVRDSKIFATGTPSLPIVFSSVQPYGSRTTGDWGGLVLNGRAPVNDPTIPNNPDAGEGASGAYGGDNPNDSSGVLQYVRVEFAGIRFTDTNELNGIALQGAGRGTVLDHIQITQSQDDGIEFFGGTANASYVFVYGARDDSLDWTQGWTGRMENMVVIQRMDDGDNGMECDNWEFGFDFEPRSLPQVRNATVVGRLGFPGQENGSGARLRAGTAGLITGGIFYNFGRSGIRIQTQESLGQIAEGNLNISNTIIFGHGSDRNFEGDDLAVIAGMLESPENNNLFVDPMLADPLNPLKPDVTLLAGSPAADARNAGTLSYIGGVDPNYPWIYEEWISWAEN